MPADLAAASVATRATYDRAKCAYSILSTSTIKPVSVSPTPTNVPGVSDWVAAPLWTQVTKGLSWSRLLQLQQCLCRFLVRYSQWFSIKKLRLLIQPTTNNCLNKNAAVDSVFASAVAAAAGSRVTTCCNVVDVGCACSDGSRPEQDEDGRC